jgi:hypothetical protein
MNPSRNRRLSVRIDEPPATHNDYLKSKVTFTLGVNTFYKFGKMGNDTYPSL